MNIYQKLADARKVIRETKVKKEGRNEYSKYDYFTPEQVETLVTQACKETSTICLTHLKADAYGVYQVLEFVNLEQPEDRISFELRTAEADMTATNKAQKMGGTDTYSERYIKQKVFQIKDNNLDFDAHDNRPVVAAYERPALGKATPKVKKPFDAVELTEYQLKLESTGSTEELKEVWLSFPQEAKDALTVLKEELKNKYAKSGI